MPKISYMCPECGAEGGRMVVKAMVNHKYRCKRCGAVFTEEQGRVNKIRCPHCEIWFVESLCCRKCGYRC